MAAMSFNDYATALGVTPEQLADMERGVEPIPDRFEKDAERVTDRGLWRIVDA
jgi:hypothetical protein